jgi:hypothetical protein
MPATLTKWAIAVRKGAASQRPKDRVVRLVGVVHGHPKLRDGTEITTTRIVDVEDDHLVSASGTRYRLDGPPARSFVQYQHGKAALTAPAGVLDAIRAALGRESVERFLWAV